MKRRDFIRNVVFMAVLMSSGKARATEHGGEGSASKEAELLRLRNRENPTVMEQKHVPAVEAPEKVKAGEWFDVAVKVGFMKEHPSEPEHWITSITLLVNGRGVARTEYKVGGVSWSHATFKIKLQETSTIEAIEHCNLHGTWIGEPFTITV